MFATNSRVVFLRISAFRRTLALATVLVIASSMLADTVFAQQYKSIAPTLTGREAKSMRSKASAALRNQATFSSGGSADIDNYFKKSFFPQMTQSNANALRLLGKYREDLVKQLRGADSPAAQEHLTKLALGVMRAISHDNYHPAVRYNAVLVLGMLDQKYPTTGANPEPPTVLTAGTYELLELLEKNEFNGVKVHPSVKVGALEGLERHMRFGVDAQYTDRATKATLAVLAQELTALEVDTDVNNWMKCQAARVLARQFKAGPNPTVQAALTKLIDDDKMSLEDRCCIVGLLEKMEYTSGADAGAKAALVPLGKLTKAVVSEGAEVARDFESLILGETPGARRPSRGGYGAGADSGPKLERRQLLSRLTQIEGGAKSLSNGLSDEDKQKLLGLTKLLTPVIDSSKDSRVLDLDVTGEVLKLESSIDTLVASWQPAPAAAATDEFVE